MALRSGHGNGAGSPRVEVLPPDELPPAQAAGADPIAAGRDAAGKVRSSAAAQALARLPRRTAFLPRKVACHPRFESHYRASLQWLEGRRSEHHSAHGGVSRGVGAMLNAARWLYAGGEFTAELAAESGDAELFKLAATLTSTARQHELAAWELGAREAAARPKPTDDHSRLIGAFGEPAKRDGAAQ